MLTRREVITRAVAAAIGVITDSAAAAESKANSASITLPSDPLPLEQVVSRVAAQSREPLGVGTDCRWDGVQVSVTDRAAAKVNAELAELLNYAWIDEQPKPVLKAGARMRGVEQQLRRKWYGGAADRLAVYAALVERPPELFEQLQRDRGHVNVTGLSKAPLLRNVIPHYFLARSYRVAAAFWHGLSREQIMEVFAASLHRAYLPWNAMTDGQKRLAFALAREMENPGPSPDFLKLKPAPQASALVQEFGVVLMGWMAPHSNHVKLVQIHRTRPPILHAYSLDPNPSIPKGAENRGNPYEVETQATPEARRRTYADLEAMPFPAAREFRQEFPMRWPDIFRQLAERLPFALYSDYFPGPPIGVDEARFQNTREQSGNPELLPLERMSVGAALDGFAGRFHRVWWRKGDAIFFRSRSWFVDRLYQTPHDVLEMCQKQFSEKGKLDREAVDRLSGLTWQEMAGIDLLAQEQLGASYTPQHGTFHALHRLLQVYRTLTEPQRERALTEGVRPDRLNAAQRRAYLETMYISDAPVELLADPPVIRFEQGVRRGIPKKKPALGVIVFATWPPKDAPPDPRRPADLPAYLYIPFPEKEKPA